jgi:P-type conjugative transfer protein TrbG
MKKYLNGGIVFAAVALGCLLVSAVPASAQVSNIAMAELYVSIMDACEGWLVKAGEIALRLLAITAVIGFAIGMKDLALSGSLTMDGIIALFVRYAFIVGLLVWLLNVPQRLALIPLSLKKIGSTISGQDISFGGLIDLFSEVTNPLVEFTNGLGWTDIGLIIIMTFIILTNLVINTDRRTYQLDLVSSAKDFMPSVSFSYPADSIKAWDSFLEEKRRERENNAVLSSGHSIDPEDLHLDYEIRGKDSLRWKPLRVWDDGVKTYIQFRKGSTKKSVEAPVLVVYEHKKEILVNYRAAPDMYVVDRVFDKAALIAGTGSAQDRVVITRLNGR